jgi:hypothetical protein
MYTPDEKEVLPIVAYTLFNPEPDLYHPISSVYALAPLHENTVIKTSLINEMGKLTLPPALLLLSKTKL